MVHVVFEFAEPLLNISPGKPASCSSLARLLAAGMFHVSYMFSHAWPSLQSWSAADTASQVQLCWCHSPPRMDCGAWAWEVQTPRPSQKSTPTCSRRASISWSTTWHRLAAVCWMTCDVCLTCHPDVDCAWLCYFEAAFSARLGRSSGHQTLSHVTHVVTRQSYIDCCDLWFYLWTLTFFN